MLESAFYNEIFQRKKLFFKNLDFNKTWKNEIEDNNEIKYSLFSEKVSKTIDFTTFDLYRDNPPAWELNYWVWKNIQSIYNFWPR